MKKGAPDDGWAVRTIRVVIPLFFYAGFVVLYGASLPQVWVRRRLFLDVLYPDAGVEAYRKLLGCVMVLGILVVLTLLFHGWRRWSWTLMFLSHVLIGTGALAFSGIVWSQTKGGFHPLFTSSWTSSGAEAGPGLYLFFASTVFLVTGGIAALAVRYRNRKI
jgi:hypothetical protein